MGSRRLILLAAALLLGACNHQQPEAPVTVEFQHTGCGRNQETKADSYVTSQLILEYTDGGLLITRTNATLNCSLVNGITCDLNVQDGVIRYHAYVTDGGTMKCLCPVERMTALVSGLRENKEYTLEYSCDNSYRPITFYYAKGLKVTFDLSLYLE